jgi:hypothetical protein
VKKKSYLPKQDQIPPYKDGKTIYQVSNWEIFSKNFVAGIGRSAGGWFFNIVILVILVNFLIPILRPFFENFSNNIPAIFEDQISEMEKGLSKASF